MSDGKQTLTAKKIREHLNKDVKVFLENNIALEGTLIDYFYDAVERDGVIVLQNDTKGEPAVIFKKYVTTIHPSPRRPNA